MVACEQTAPALWGGTCMSNNTQAQISHALAKLAELSLKLEVDSSAGKIRERDLFQIGYNAGRLSELTDLGREVWDILKDDIDDRDYQSIAFMAARWREEYLPEETGEQTPQPRGT